MKGMFITFEGIEGSGKSTQIVKLANYLKSHGNRVVLTREPGGTAIGDQIRKILLDPANKGLDPAAELLLYAASRAQHLSEVILPALADGSVVLCDRFSDATLAYQGYGRGVDRKMIQDLDRIVTAGIRPDLTLLLDIDAAVGLARARGRNSSCGLDKEARFENEEAAFHERVRQGYLALAKQEPERVRAVDASPEPNRIEMEIRKIIAPVLGIA
ncbi:MAG TPA: dTMP kinase [Bacteroidota bacterium]|nr:dTMP kinase [Bacteroidota bacterium]HXY54512.1 dTMP kinase [Nitrospirota bacterium]